LGARLESGGQQWIEDVDLGVGPGQALCPAQVENAGRFDHDQRVGEVHVVRGERLFKLPPAGLARWERATPAAGAVRTDQLRLDVFLCNVQTQQMVLFHGRWWMV
jgi:hypothetical protein